MKRKALGQILSCFVACAVATTSVVPCAVYAKEPEVPTQINQNYDDYLGEDEMVENSESGDYVVYTTSEEIPVADAEQIAVTDIITIYETDLTNSEQRILNQDEDVQIEENFFLFGAGVKKEETPKADKKKDKKKEKEDKKAAEKEKPKSKEEKELEEQREKKQQLREALRKQREEEQNCSEWNYQMVHADDVQSDETVIDPVRVAILDSGVELIAGINVYSSINLVDEEQDITYYMNDMTGHGTAVADIIQQICPQAQLCSVRVLDRENKGRLSDVVEGIYWCIENDVDIINMSFGTSRESEILNKAIKDATDKGILIVSSAGNDGISGDVEYPAAFAEVMAVGAVDTSGNRTEESTAGPEVEIVAPGEQILTKSMLGLETVNSGTSMATPHVTGAAALLMMKDRTKKATEIREVLDASSNPIGNEEEYGNGLLDLEYACEVLEEGLPEQDDVVEQKEETENTSISENTLTISDNQIDEESLYSQDQNDEARPIETFEEVDYVEGRWGKIGHQQLVTDNIGPGGDLKGFFNATEIEIIKKGSIYPDKDESGYKNSDKGEYCPEWHGMPKYNYVANYIYATRIAQKAGDTSSVKSVKGQSTNSPEKMKKRISNDGIHGKRWDTIIGHNYSSVSNSTKTKWRRLFLYGMACHAATDVFAHAAYAEKNGTLYSMVDHHSKKFKPDYFDKENSLTIAPNRFDCAKDTAWNVLVDAYYNYEGDVSEFSSYLKSYWGGFYLCNIIKYVKESNTFLSNSDINYYYKKINITITPEDMIVVEDCKDA